MGQSESSIPSHASDEYGNNTLGYRVLGVQPSSPAAKAGLVSFFDFLVGCDGEMLIGNDDEEDMDLIAALKGSIDKPLDLLVFNIKSQSTRIITITPSNNWPGHGLLGVTIRLDSYSGAEDRLVRVLSTLPSSPAENAGLLPLTDYLLGTRTASFSSDELLSATLYENRDSVVEVYVYNTESDVVRVVSLRPSAEWEGSGGGLLGAEVGTGYLHRLPKKCRGSDGRSVEMAIRQKVVRNGEEAEVNGDAVVDFTADEKGVAAAAVSPAGVSAVTEVPTAGIGAVAIAEAPIVKEVAAVVIPEVITPVPQPPTPQTTEEPPAPLIAMPIPTPPPPPPESAPANNPTGTNNVNLSPLPPPPMNASNGSGGAAPSGYRSFISPFRPPPFMTRGAVPAGPTSVGSD